MKKNILPFGIIAIVGIFVAVIIFYVGVNQREDIQQAEENGGEVTEEGAADDPESIFANNCATCHGDDLSGDSGPDLTKVDSKLSEDEIHDVIMNGQGSMPAGLVEAEEADILAAWLSGNAEEASDDEEGEDEGNSEEATSDPEGIFANNCATCHGDDLSGDMGPDLTKIGGELSEDEIHDVIINGEGSMPAGIIEGEEANVVANWLSEMK